MTSEEFHALVEEYTDPSANDDGDAPLTLARLAELERQKGLKFPAFYKELLSMYGAGDFGYVTVLSPDPDSQFPIWETAARLENRECNFMGVIELDSDYFGFLIVDAPARLRGSFLRVPARSPSRSFAFLREGLKILLPRSLVNACVRHDYCHRWQRKGRSGLYLRTVGS